MNINKLSITTQSMLYKKWAQVVSKTIDYDRKYRQTIEDLYADNSKSFDAWFNGQDKVIIPFIDNPSTIKKTKNQVDIENYLQENGFEITDYLNGICLNKKYNRQENIGTALATVLRNKIKAINDEAAQMGDDANNHLQNDKEAVQNEYMHMKHLFETDPQRKAAKIFKENLVIVFTQNPHEVFQMSTNKSWDNCMTIEKGKHWQTLYDEIQDGGFIACLIKEQDINNLNKSISRVWVRKIVGRDGKIYAMPEKNAYGSSPEIFMQRIKEWIRQKQNEIPLGIYELRGSYYTDSYIGTKKNEMPQLLYIPEQLQKNIESDDTSIASSAMIEILSFLKQNRELQFYYPRDLNILATIIIRIFDNFDDFYHVAIYLLKNFYANIAENYLKNFSIEDWVLAANSISEYDIDHTKEFLNAFTDKLSNYIYNSQWNKVIDILSLITNDNIIKEISSAVNNTISFRIEQEKIILPKEYQQKLERFIQ